MSSPTPNKGYTYPAHNGSINTWDTPIDADFDQIDLNVGGVYAVTCTSTIVGVTYFSSHAAVSSTANSITFPTSIAQNMYYEFTGAFNSSCVINFPAVGSFYAVNVSGISSGSPYVGISGFSSLSQSVSGAVLVVSDGTFATQIGKVTPEFASGVGIIFAQAAAPTNWTIDATVNDRALRIVSAAGGGTGGAWAISGLTITVGAHTLTTGEIASHNHSYNETASNNSGYTNGAKNANSGESGNNTGNTGGGGSHSHTGSGSGDGSWRPAYYNVIRCTKN